MSSPNAIKFAPSTPKRAPLLRRDNQSEDRQKPPTSTQKAPPTPTAAVAVAVTTNRTTAAPPLPGVSTPGRDPLGKHFQHLQLHETNYNAGSTAAATMGSTGTYTALTMSPLPAGSIASAQSPMRTSNGGIGSNAGTPTRHYALTPVANNTTTTTGTFNGTCTGTGTDCGDQANPNLMDEQLDFDLDNLDLDGTDVVLESRGWQPPRNLISPNDNFPTEDLLSPSLQGDHLQFPAELCNGNAFSARRPVQPDGPRLPPLAKRGLFPLGRKNSKNSYSAYPNDIIRRDSNSNHNNSHRWTTDDADPKKLHIPTFAPALANLPSEHGTVQPLLIEKPCSSVTRAPELASFVPMEDPVPFPTAASKSKGYSFTGMTQYEKRLHMEASTAASIITPQRKTLKQYQPSRRDHDLVAVGDIPEEELKGIFTQRRMSATTRNRGEVTAGKVSHNTPSDSNPGLQTNFPLSEQGDDDSDYQLALPGDGSADASPVVREGRVQQLVQTIPLAGRQFSIPSIRMANNLGGGSMASCNTYYTDDDESLLMYRDDASLSSRGSFCNLEDIQAAFRISLSVEQQQQRQQSSSFESDNQQQSHLLVPSIGGVEATSAAVANEIDDSLPLPSPLHYQNISSRRRSHKRKDQRDQSAYEWLRTVKAGADEVAEAASSKFLNGGGVGCCGNNKHRQDHDLPSFRERPQKRLSATPAVESRAFAMLKDLSKDKKRSIGSQASFS